MKFLMGGFIALAVAVGVPGCHIHGRRSDPGSTHRVHSRSGDSEYVVVSSHRHDDNCGHYYSSGRWYAHPGHRHGPGCGHEMRSGIWIVID